jgi:hypothetical protein
MDGWRQITTIYKNGISYEKRRLRKNKNKI